MTVICYNLFLLVTVSLLIREGEWEVARKRKTLKVERGSTFTFSGGVWYIVST